ncbi:Methyltransferase type 11 (fragment) [groundwater metagenome]|uniref:Methyltransferase type 11 n=1 Tax=groundwater metagenome TaxID=717931 RepID=A0A098E9C6_9ZZZZ
MYDLIINNDFKYVEAGILDKTHLRFFCKKNMIDLFNSSDLKIKNILRIPNTLSKKRILLNFISFGLFREFFVTQYLIIGIKK